MRDKKQTPLLKLKIRQKNMQMPYEVIAQKTDLGISTVKNFFRGRNSSVSTFEKIATVLQCNIDIKSDKEGHELYEAQIEKKALAIVKRVMKTSALELQQPNKEAYERMVTKAKASIRKMPNSHVWS